MNDHRSDGVIVEKYDPYPAGKPRDRETLERQIMDPCIVKNDAEWWAMTEVERLRASQERLKSAIEYAHSEGFQWPSDPMAEFSHARLA